MTEEDDYRSAFIAVAPDCPVPKGTVPEREGTVAAVQYEYISGSPYAHTQSDVLWETYRSRGGPGTREELFSKPQACLRASPLGKKFGWGLHFDAEGRVALVGRETPEYEAFIADQTLEHRAAMRSKR
ncbi:MAG: DUF6157 family protein [Treponemataceae bacterium]